MNEPSRESEKLCGLRSALVSSAGHFNMGEDEAGLKDFSESMEMLEGLIDSEDRGGKLRICSDRFLPALKLLYASVQNQDMIGITDLLEYTFIPLAEEWIAEGERQ